MLARGTEASLIPLFCALFCSLQAFIEKKHFFNWRLHLPAGCSGESIFCLSEAFISLGHCSNNNTITPGDWNETFQ